MKERSGISRKSRMRRGLSAVMAAVLLVLTATPASAAGNGDFEHVTSHVNLLYARKLAIHYPSKNVETTAAGFQITGTSNPEETLTMNGQTVDKRGANGTFAVYVALADGANAFTFSQGGESVTVNITKGSRNAGIPNVTTSSEDGVNSSGPLPQYDVAAVSGQVFTMKCSAANAVSAVATVNGSSYTMTKEKSGVFTAPYQLPAAEAMTDLGPVQYTVTYQDGKTQTGTSAGRLFVAGSIGQFQIQVKNASASVFNQPATSGTYLMTAKKGAVDTIRDSKGDMYQLSSGGWIQAKAVQPLASSVSTQNNVSSVSFTGENKGETFTLHGTSHPFFTASHTNEGLSLTFYKTTGVGQIDTSGSRLFSGATVSEADGATTINFALNTAGTLWGYVVEYSEGKTMIYCKYRPRRAEGSKPLEGVTVAVDAGHGGTDSGALGITYGYGVVEKDINLATAIALQKKLELLGANVIMLRDGDNKVELTTRLEIAQANRVDFLISLHANSTAYTSKAMSANGTEVYYHEGISQILAKRVQEGITSSTNRVSRGAKRAAYVITLNSYAPSILVEMGFMLNPWDFDSMCSKQGIYNTVTSISNSIVASLS